ncbi:hypothetical protein [uncultured Winogradskyella sp.]|uniref:hypothetical protein n=1 Tax=uncultured Winogradskyella sp. TaxID=395353 RepID=UPI00261A607C|nr:hypothetical protein [uncultured Winogradskyella sp.]
MTDKIKKLDIEYDFVFIINCLPEKERVKFNISQDLMNFLAKEGVNQFTSICSNKVQVLEVFSYLKKLAKNGDKFCIHFISHGSKDGLWIKETQEDILWSEIRQHFNEINNLLGGTLTINMTSCLGLHGIKIVDENSTDYPFFGLVGYSKDLEVSQGKKINELFYSKLLNNKNVNEAVIEMKQELNDSNLYCISSQLYKAIKNTSNKHN